jgi:autotransporter translocation and assembly factor TamB
MEKKLFRRLTMIALVLTGSISLLLALGFFMAQTPWVKKELQELLTQAADKKDLNLSLEGLSGIAPLKWSFDKAFLKSKDGSFVKLEHVRVRISLSALLSRKISIKSLVIEKADIGFMPLEENVQDSLSTLPFDLSAKTIRCKELHLENLRTQKQITLNLHASAKVDRLLEEVRIDLKLAEKENLLKLAYLSSDKKDKIETSLSLHLLNSQDLADFLNLPFAPSLTLLSKGSGKKSKPPFFLSIESKINALNIPNYAAFDQSSVLSAELFWNPSSEDAYVSCSKCHFNNPLLQFSLQCTLSSSWRPILGSLSSHIENLSSFPLPLKAAGDLDLNIKLQKDSLLASIASKELRFGSQIYSPSLLKLSAVKKEEAWEGFSKGSFTHASLPWEEMASFRLEERKLIVSDLSFACAEAKLGGQGSFSLEDHSYQGSFFLHADELRPFRSFFPSSEIDGKLGGGFSIEGQKSDLSVEVSLLGHGIRYQDSLIGLVRCDAKIDHLFSSPSGPCSLDLENLLFQEMLLSSVHLTASPTQEGELFSLNVLGEWKKPLKWETSGLLSKKDSQWKILFSTCSGSFLNSSFSLKDPFTFEKDSKSFILSPSTWNIKEGFLKAEATIQDTLSAKVEAQHIPLDLLAILYPHMAFQGSYSFQGSLSGSKENVQGTFLATLEEADFLDNKAKGSLQLHITSSQVQAHCHLYATKNQFLDCSATIPLNVWKIDSEKPLVAELTMQGAIEELFDFINATSHKASGWITAHLFLSGTLHSPFMQGSIECQNGSYKNFSTGTAFEQIQAKALAVGQKLDLVHLEAVDEKKGSLTATGTFLLQPRQNYPFDIITHLENVKLAESGFIDGSATGSLQIKGDKQSATVSGHLTVQKAEIRIFDGLPSEIPSLPVTFIHKPFSLETKPLSSPYPFYIDAELEAKDSVFVTGKGLNSEWKGAIHLTGTASNLLAKGSLTLIKGEFSFSGKTFTLMQGDISFSDKPTPSSYLKLNGELQMASATILAQMQGALSSPKLTFQSIPALPTSSILSLILFNKDVSEISTLQALQLASVIVSLSGNGGPDVLNSIRKSIGLDRLNIVGKDGTDEISVQIGWYLNHGITLFLSQSATSSDVTVEVDLKNGFIFQAETQNQEEGKFSFKWNKNY